MLWLFAGVMMVAAIAIAVGPLLWRRGDNQNTAPRGAYDIEVYRDQLKELETEVDLGEIPRAEAATARLEIERRILRAAGQEKTASAALGKQRRPWLLAGVLSVLIAAFGLGLYLHLGSPDLEGHPYVYHENDEVAAPGLAKGQKETLEKLVERLIAYLKDHSDNTEGWIQLRQAMVALGDSPRAAQLMQKAVEAHPDDITLRVMYGESLIVMSDGQVTPAAKLTFEQALMLAPHHPGAEYYLALADFQNGDLEAAYKGWTALAAESPADAPWLPQVNDRLRETAARLGLPAPAPAPVARNGPTPDQQAAAQAMTPADRDAMIRGMVQKLAARLKSTPGDYEGWRRLGRAYEVLGEKAKALAALRQAQKTAPAADQAAIAQDIARLTGQK